MQQDCYIKNYFTRACIDSCPFRSECDNFNEARKIARQNKIRAELDEDLNAYYKRWEKELKLKH